MRGWLSQGFSYINSFNPNNPVMLNIFVPHFTYEKIEALWGKVMQLLSCGSDVQTETRCGPGLMLLICKTLR